MICTPRILRGMAILAGSFVPLLGCAAAPQEPAQPSKEVIAALEAAARGESHADDLHPQTRRSGKALTALQEAFDVRHYALALRVIPATYRIEGELTVTFEALESLSTIELDLDPKLEILEVVDMKEPLSLVRDEDSFVVTLATAMERGERRAVTVRYAGQPHVAMAPPWYGGFVWADADGAPWFATAVQGHGCDLWWPCKDTFKDKPEEGVTLAISAPKGVTIASVGSFAGMDEGSDGFDTWHWHSRHPYTGYAIAINGGPYEIVERSYKGINGTDIPIFFWALPKNVAKAEKLVDEDLLHAMAFFERLIGPYPWGDEKAGFVETPHLGMEHQTINGYGEQYRGGKHGYDWLLHHELSHEWFGNLMTHANAEDAWLHEGYGSYMQAVYAEETVGAMGYYDILYDAYVGNEHCDPVVNPLVKDAGEAFENRDIYTKGAWMLHTLRNYIGDEAFWRGTRELVYGTDEPWNLAYPISPRYRSTDDFIRIMSAVADEDLSWLVDTYLREAGSPELVIDRSGDRLSLHWEAPGSRPFPLPVEISINGVLQRVEVTRDETEVVVKANSRLVIDPSSRILRALPIIGDCEAQTQKQVEANIERFTRMASEYGWQRPTP